MLTPFAVALSSSGATSIREMLPTVLISSVRFQISYTISISLSHLVFHQYIAFDPPTIYYNGESIL